MKKSICIIAFSPIAKDARVLRQIQYLSPLYKLTVIGYGQHHPDYVDDPDITWIQLDRETQPTVPSILTALKEKDYKNIRFCERIVNKLKQIMMFILSYSGFLIPYGYNILYKMKLQYPRIWHLAIETKCDAYHANDWNTLPVAAEAAMRNNAVLVLDLHEYAPLEYEERPRWWVQKHFITYILKKYAPKAHATTTVNSFIAEKYREEFGFNPIVIMNAPEKYQTLPQVIMNSSIKLIHHGIASRNRHLELMIQTIARCNKRYSLHLMLIPNDYVEELKQLSEMLAPGRVFFHDPVNPEDITKHITQFDVGFIMFPPSNYNYHVCLPNKFFDYISAGLAVCIGPSPVMEEIIKKYTIGVVCNTFKPEDMASILNEITSDQWAAMREASRTAADQFNAQIEMKKLITLYEQIL